MFGAHQKRPVHPSLAKNVSEVGRQAVLVQLLPRQRAQSHASTRVLVHRLIPQPLPDTGITTPLPGYGLMRSGWVLPAGFSEFQAEYIIPGDAK